LALLNSHRTIFVAVAPGSRGPPGGELEEIQFLLGHVSIQTKEPHLGCTQRISWR
jgi:hypothetical protein